MNPGEIREMLVRFFPQSTGQKTATLSLVNNVTGKNPLNVALNGTGVALNPDIEVVPDPWNYGEVRIGTSSELIFTVLSSGTGMLKVNGVNIIDNNNFTIEAGGGSFDLPPGGIREVLVRFSPQSAGIKNANLRFETNVADKNPLNVSLEGTGVLPEEKDIEVNPPSWSYGDVPVGAQFDKIFVVANTGIGIVEVTSTTLIGSNEFSIQFGGGGFNLGPGQVREILIRFAPQSGGFKYSVLSLANNVSGKNPLEVPLHGNGIPSGFSIRMATGWSLLSFPVNKCFFEGTPPTDQPACVELVDVEDLGFTTLADWFTSVLTSENPVDPPWRIVIGSDGAMDSTIDPMFHSLKHMSPISGCWVKIKTEAGETTLTLNGSLYDPDCAIPLPVGWELVGYPLTTGYYDMEPEPDTPGITWTRVDPPAAEYVFRSIDNQYRIIIGADGAYDPTINIIFNSLHYIGPGDAFWVKTYQAVNLVYGNMGTGTESLAAVPGRRQVVTKRGVTPTSTFMIIYGEVTRDDIALEAGNRVQVFTQTGTLCGDFTVEHTGLYGMMLVYGDEPYTPEVEGARSGEGLIFYVNGRPAGTGREIYWCDSKLPEHVDLAYYSLPEVSMLDQNYPNPLNPDTWIPYQLKEEARVQIRIYTTTGQLVRTLNLGQKPAGFYTDKSRAAYWDGRNEAGESVASGIYFYSITAGDYTATKKMTVMR